MPRQLIFRNFVTLGTDYEGYNWKDDLPRLCFMLYTPIFGILWKYLTILEFITKEAAVWSLWRPLCDFWNFQEKMENFGFLLKISRFWTIMSFNFPKWRWEGYIIIKSCFFLSVLVTGVVYPIATHWSWTGLGWLAQEWALNTDDWLLNGDHCLLGSDDSSGDSLTLPALPLFIWRARFSLCLAVLSSEQGDTCVQDLFWNYKSC